MISSVWVHYKPSSLVRIIWTENNEHHERCGFVVLWTSSTPQSVTKNLRGISDAPLGFSCCYAWSTHRFSRSIREEICTVLTVRVTKMIYTAFRTTALAVYSCHWSWVIKPVSQHKAVSVSHCCGLIPMLADGSTCSQVPGRVMGVRSGVRGQGSDLQLCPLPCLRRPIRASPPVGWTPRTWGHMLSYSVCSSAHHTYTPWCVCSLTSSAGQDPIPISIYKSNHTSLLSIVLTQQRRVTLQMLISHFCSLIHHLWQPASKGFNWFGASCR